MRPQNADPLGVAALLAICAAPASAHNLSSVVVRGGYERRDRMVCRILMCIGVTLALLMAAALPAAAHNLNVTITPDCTSCSFNAAVFGDTGHAGDSVGVDYSFDVIENGVTYHVSKHVDTNTDANGGFL